MTKAHFRSGRAYTLSELAQLAKLGLETYKGGITQAKAVEELNKRFRPQRGEFRQSQISMALQEPGKNPGMIMSLIEAFTDYQAINDPRYMLVRKKGDIVVKGAYTNYSNEEIHYLFDYDFDIVQQREGFLRDNEWTVLVRVKMVRRLHSMLRNRGKTKSEVAKYGYAFAVNKLIELLQSEAWPVQSGSIHSTPWITLDSRHIDKLLEFDPSKIHFGTFYLDSEELKPNRATLGFRV